jgi:hypothetical protein
MSIPAERRTLLPFAGAGDESSAEAEDSAHADALGADLRRLPTGLPAAFTVDDLARLIAAVDAYSAAAAAEGEVPSSSLLDASQCWTAGTQSGGCLL